MYCIRVISPPYSLVPFGTKTEKNNNAPVDAEALYYINKYKEILKISQALALWK
jgi:hypothetical protein